MSEFSPFDFPEINKLFEELNNTIFDESGRGAILIATGHIDEHLTNLIQTVLPKEISIKHKNSLFKYPGPISSFSAKIELAYIFRIISKRMFDNLNALRKIRNDAAHSNSKFELHQLNEKLFHVYNIGDGFPQFIRELSGKALFQTKIDFLKKNLAELNLSEEEVQDHLKRIINEKDTIDSFVKQLPFWELIYGLTFLCAWISYTRRDYEQITSSITTFRDIVKMKKSTRSKKNSH